jgi:hypothetical protein
MSTILERKARFEIKNGKWIKFLGNGINNQDWTYAVNIDAIKAISCNYDTETSGKKREGGIHWIKFYLGEEYTYNNSVGYNYSLIYTQDEYNDYLRDRKTFEDLLFNQI